MHKTVIGLFDYNQYNLFDYNQSHVFDYNQSNAMQTHKTSQVQYSQSCSNMKLTVPPWNNSLPNNWNKQRTQTTAFDNLNYRSMTRAPAWLALLSRSPDMCE
jgi:hypothetical protein